MTGRTARIDPARLRALLDGINAFGRNPQTGGFNRIGFGDADMQARRWLAEEMGRRGLAVHTDAVGNLFGRFGPAEGPCVMAGSHVDTVAEGGAFDGALGVAVALECVLAMKQAGIAPRTAVEVVATAEEEGRFGGMLGSQAIVGAVDADWIAAAADASGVRLADAMRAHGLEPGRVGEARRPAGSVRAFVELHVEQGPVLETARMSVGIATAVSGVCNLEFVLEGQANHSGTTPMDTRADAFAGLARLGTAIGGIIARCGTDQSRVTIGRVDLSPNQPHTIAGRAAFSVIVRDTDAAAMTALREAIVAEAGEAAGAHGLAVHHEERSRLAPVELDPGLRRMLVERAEALGLPALEMPSGAGHDAQTMQALCPSALIFVPSRGGISHAPDEWTEWADIENGASLMLSALIELAR